MSITNSCLWCILFLLFINPSIIIFNNYGCSFFGFKYISSVQTEDQESHLVERIDSLKLIQNKSINYLKNKNSSLLYNAILNYHQEKYAKGLLKMESVKLYLLDGSEIIEYHFYLSLLYKKTGQIKKALANFVLIDTHQNFKFENYPHIKNAYAYLIDYYRDSKEEDLLVYYRERFKNYNLVMEERLGIYSENAINHLDYDLLETKKEGKDWFRNILGYIFVFLVGSGILLMTGIFLRPLFLIISKKAAFLNIQKEPYSNSTQNILEKLPVESIGAVNKEMGISQEVTEDILNKLKNFEKKKLFIKYSSLKEVADHFKTNSSYLSKIVNIEKGKHFGSYIKDLKIEYALEHLPLNSKLQSYTVKAIANEFGFNNAESFSKAFKKKTGQYPSKFIKKIKNC